MNKKAIFMPIILVLFFLLFTTLDSGGDYSHIDLLIQPGIFAMILTLSIFYARFRKYFVVAAVILQAILVITYLLQMWEVSNWFGSLGFGILLISVFSYIVMLIKKGRIDRF